jgi:hypothetical protein
MTFAEIIAKLRAKPSQDVPFTGMVLGGIQKGASYTAAKNGTLGVPTFWVGGKLRTSSLDILKRLGVEPEAPAKTNRPAETTPSLAAAAPAVQLAAAAPKSVPAQSRKPPAPKAVAARKPPARVTPRKAKSVAAE